MPWSRQKLPLNRQLSLDSSGLPPITENINLEKDKIIKFNIKVGKDNKLFEIKFLGFDFPDIPFIKINEHYTLKNNKENRVTPRLFFLLKLNINDGNGYDTMLGTKQEWLPFYVSSGNNSEDLSVGNVNPFTGFVSTYNHVHNFQNYEPSINELYKLLSSNNCTQLESDDRKAIFYKKYNELNTDNLPFMWVLDKYFMYKELLKYAEDNIFLKDINPILFLGLISPITGWVNKCSFKRYYTYYSIQALLDFTNNPILKEGQNRLEVDKITDFKDLCEQFVEKYDIKDDTKVAAIKKLKTNFKKAILLFEPKKKDNSISKKEMKNKERLCTKDFDILNSQLKNIFVFDKIDSEQFTGPQPTFNGETGSKISGSHTFRINIPELKHIKYELPIISSRELNDLIGTCNLYGINLNDSFNKNNSKNRFIEFYKEILKNNNKVLNKNNQECNIDELIFKDYLDILSDGFVPSISDIFLELLKQIKSNQTESTQITKGGYTKTKKKVNILFRRTKHSNKPNKHRKIRKNRKENKNKKIKPIKNITKRKNNYIRHIGKSRGRSRTKKKI